MSGKAKKAAPKKKANGYKMPAPIPVGEVIIDTIMKKKWRIGPSIGVGGFGEIYSACDHESSSKKDYPFVIKIEPHENGPLFVEKNFYMRNASQEEITKYMKTKKISLLGMPTYFGNGSHEFKGEKYRYLVLERFGKDIWSLFKDAGRTFPPSTVFQLGLQMLEVLEYIHNRGYVHADIKGANILLGVKKGTENQSYLLDYGLATRISEKEFKPDPKCAHNGTIEYTSRDAHLGVPTMRGDLEILAYNMLQWLVGELPWEKSLKQPKAVQDMKEAFMKNISTNMKKIKNVPDALVKFFEYINTLKPKDTPDYAKCRQFFESYLKSQGHNRCSKLEFVSSSKKSRVSKSKDVTEAKEKGNNSISVEIDKRKPKNVTRKTKKKESKTETEVTENSENKEPNNTFSQTETLLKNRSKRKSNEPVLGSKLKKIRLSAKHTPPAKRNHANTATQTSVDKLRQRKKNVSFDSPVAEVIGDKKASTTNESANSSGDIFEDSFVITEKKVKAKKRLVSDEEITIKKVVKKRVTTKPKGRSWRDAPAIVNGKSPTGS